MSLQDLAERLETERAAGCLHANIVEAVRHPDGSIDGRCRDCGADGFPIRDVSWEEWNATALEAQHRCSLVRMAEDGLTYSEALAASLNEAGGGR